MQCWRIFCSLLIISFSVGCATWHRYGIHVTRPERYRIAVLPVQDTVKIKKLKNIQTLSKSSPQLAQETQRIEEQMQTATRDIAESLNRHLQNTYFYEVIPQKEVEAALKDLHFSSPHLSLTPAQIQKVGEKLNVPLVLESRLSGYGKLQKRWLTFLLAAGLMEGVVEGAVIGTATSPWVGILIGSEEVVQEGVTWIGGDMLFNKLFTPVILEERLYAVTKGRAIWFKTEIARVDSKELKKYPKEKRKKKELRLRLTSEVAVKKIVNGLEKLAWQNAKGAVNTEPDLKSPAL